ARAASTAAFSARILVWNAMPSMTEMMSTILRDDVLMAPIVSTTCATTAPPLRATSDAVAARPLAWRALSAFCLTVDVISSIEDAGQVARCHGARQVDGLVERTDDRAGDDGCRSDCQQHGQYGGADQQVTGGGVAVLCVDAGVGKTLFLERHLIGQGIREVLH